MNESAPGRRWSEMPHQMCTSQQAKVFAIREKKPARCWKGR